MDMINLEEIVIVNVAGMLVLLFSQLSRIESKREKHLDDYLFGLYSKSSG